MHAISKSDVEVWLLGFQSRRALDSVDESLRAICEGRKRWS